MTLLSERWGFSPALRQSLAKAPASARFRYETYSNLLRNSACLGDMIRRFAVLLAELAVAPCFFQRSDDHPPLL